MKKYIFLSIIVLTLQSCYKPGKIEIQNNVSSARITNIYWGDTYIGSELLPGETTDKVEIRKHAEKLPASNKVSFTMSANGKEVLLETTEEYPLDQDEELLITIDDNTEVINPGD